MKKISKNTILLVIAIVMLVGITSHASSVTYQPLSVPSIQSSFKTWMSFRAITNQNSPQYKLIRAWGWSDANGFMRVNGERDIGINDDYYIIALGSYYGTTIGTKYRITTNTGSVFYGILGDCKANRDTDSTHRYCPINNNIVEFIVDTLKLNKDVKKMGSANVYPPLSGSIVKIEKISFF